MDAVTPAVVYTPLLNVAAPERCRQGVYTPVLNAVIPAETREQVKLMGNSLIAILIHPEVADQMEEHLQRLVTAIEATGKSLAMLPPTQEPAPAVEPEAPPVEKPTKVKPEKGPYGQFWRELQLRGFYDSYPIKEWLASLRTAEGSSDRDVLCATFLVTSRSFISPNTLARRLGDDIPLQAGASGIQSVIRQAAKTAIEKSEKTTMAAHEGGER